MGRGMRAVNAEEAYAASSPAVEVRAGQRFAISLNDCHADVIGEKIHVFLESRKVASSRIIRVKMLIVEYIDCECSFMLVPEVRQQNEEFPVMHADLSHIADNTVLV